MHLKAVLDFMKRTESHCREQKPVCPERKQVLTRISRSLLMSIPSSLHADPQYAVE
jgi:hypothetical protein